jgi:hypothetical protein
LLKKELSYSSSTLLPSWILHIFVDIIVLFVIWSSVKN